MVTGQRILAIDDDRFFTRLAGHMSARDGHRLDECNDAVRIDTASLKNYDFILLDILMPGINGVDMLSRIKSCAPDTEVILMTSVEDGLAKRVRDFANDIGINLRGILRKPFNRQMLSAMLTGKSRKRTVAPTTATLALLQKETEEAMQRKELLLKFWPQILLRSNRPAGYDVSLHLRQGRTTRRISSEIVHAIQGAKFSFRYDLMTIANALPVLRSENKRMSLPSSIAVSVSPDSVGSVEFRENLTAILNEQNVQKRQLALEVPASCLGEAFKKLQVPLQLLRAIGIRISAKGSPRELLSIIKADDLLFDEIKIGELWTAEVTTDNDVGESIEQLLEMTSRKCIVSTAEGVSDAKTADFLLIRGCDIGQGMYFSEPLDIDAVRRAISQDNANEKH
jgi:EAL domain-containing protein (putative c-di-GMP-specific phosphodiesterase class I)/ActR/RegA family two-component response regulator